MTRRVRLSTVVLTVVFAGVLALYVQVRPPPVAVTVTGTGTVETSVVPTPAPLRTVPLTKEPTAVTTSAPAPTTSAVPEVAPPSDRARPRSTSETSPPPTSGSAP